MSKDAFNRVYRRFKNVYPDYEPPATAYIKRKLRYGAEITSRKVREKLALDMLDVSLNGLDKPAPLPDPDQFSIQHLIIDPVVEHPTRKWTRLLQIGAVVIDGLRRRSRSRTGDGQLWQMQAIRLASSDELSFSGSYRTDMLLTGGRILLGGGLCELRLRTSRHGAEIGKWGVKPLNDKTLSDTLDSWAVAVFGDKNA
jgi:hypothetical protein